MSIFDFLRSKKSVAPTCTPTGDKLSPVPESPSGLMRTLTVKVAGTKDGDQSKIKSLGTRNPDYALDKRALIKKYPDGKTIYEYSFPPLNATFEFEPTNEYDPNAIKVLIQGIHVGYVKRGSCTRIKNLILQEKIIDISAKIRGGKGKDLFLTCVLEENEKPSSTDYDLEKVSSDFFISLTLTLRE